MKLYVNTAYLNQNSDDVTIQFHETLTGYKYIRLRECKLYNSWYNITENNNILKFTITGKQPAVKVIEPGNYNVDTLSQAIGRIKFINFKRMHATGKTLLLLDDTYKLDFRVKKNFAEILGFDQKLYTSSQISPNRANFLPVSEYVVHCDIIDTQNYINGQRCDYLQILTLQDTQEINKQVTYSFPNPIQVQITNLPINSIRIWVTDQNNNPINFHNYPISYQLELL